MLTQAHLRTLRDHPSAYVRADIAAAVAGDFAAGRLMGNEIKIAEQILEGLAHDFDARVRRALSEHVKACPYLTRSIALTLAADMEDTVALPVIEYSPILSDADLISFIRTDDLARQLAVARRATLGAAVTDALVETGRADIVHVVLGNDDADISEKSLLKISVRFQGETAIETLLIARPALPFSVCEVLIASLSDEMKQTLIIKHRLPAFMAGELMTLTRERVLVELIASYDIAGHDALAHRLHQKELLTPTLLLRALCIGECAFFESAMAALAGVPLNNARTLLHDPGTGGLRALYQQSGLPPALFTWVKVGIDVVRTGYLERGRTAFTRHLINQLILHDDSLSPGDLEHVLTELVHRLGAEKKSATVPKASGKLGWSTASQASWPAQPAV